jgi:predicted ArsR family transcriptional regulator
MSEPAERTSVHRALADGHRARIVDELDRHPGGLDVTRLADTLGVHENTVRWHLGVLADAGLVDSRRAERSAPGRPRILYSLRNDADSGNGADYRLLATIATGIVSDLPEAEARSFAAGQAWGGYLVQRPRPGAPLDEGDAVRRVVEFLAEEGFRPEADARRIDMHRCPFRDVIDSGDSPVCVIHRGLIAGALETLGSDLEVERLDAFVEPGLCTAYLAPRNRKETE